MMRFDFTGVPGFDPADPGIDVASHLRAVHEILGTEIGDPTVPKLIELFRAQRLRELAPGYNVKNEDASPFKPRDRAADCSDWIKKNNIFTVGDPDRKRVSGERKRRSKFAMAQPLSFTQYERHAIHLMSSLLSIRTNASPFTLVLDDLSQRSLPLVRELVMRGVSRNINVVIVTFETTDADPAARTVPAFGRSGDAILTGLERAMCDRKESLVIIDSMYDMIYTAKAHVVDLFNLVVEKYASTLVGIYHQDMLPGPKPYPYLPDALETLKFMATTIITCKSLAHVLAAKAATQRSLPEPTYGLLQGAEGIVQSLDANDARGIVLEVDFRRKSGRDEKETYFLRPSNDSDYNAPLKGLAYGTLRREFVVLLETSSVYRSDEILNQVKAAADDYESTFNLDLTEKQRAAREGVVLPYFDAQKAEGGEGGRILYDMGEEDDFDEEEDEI